MKYATIRDWDSNLDSDTARVVVCEDDEPEFTGIWDAQGNKLYRVRYRVPMGFHHRGDTE